ncbi:ABC transporter substrate-binding protein [Tepidiforma sp.]|uniref:ABC transporter substrate-binding protein n=1 Tax=Tepidiforma sp. TaxID=2682230 RepID=UPI002ADE6528|nr:ABC transporter substrate-binding protein [Tepidiforma sp.]
MRTRNRWTALLMLFAAVAMVLAAACGGDDDDDTGESPTAGQTAPAGQTPAQTEKPKYDTGASDTEIKIGGIYPFSGPAAAYGTIGKTVEAYFKMVNEQGGINGRKITFITKDDAYSPDKTVQAARELVEQEKVLFIFNTLGTPPNTAIWDYLNQQKIPQLFVATGASKWGADPKTHPWTIGWQPDYQSESAIYVEWLNKEKPNAKVAILYQNDDYGKDYVEGFKKALGTKASSVIVKEATYATTDASVSAQVTQLKESGADTFFLVATPKFATQALVTATQVGWKPTILLNSVSQSIPAVLDPAAQQGADLSNIITTFYIKDPGDPQWANDKAIQDYKAFMQKYYPEGNVNDGFNVYGYSVAQTLVHVLKQAGNNLTRENIMKQATSIKDLRIDTLLPGILINTSPVDSPTPDYYPIQAEQLAKYNPGAKKFDLFGQVIDTGKK